MGGFFNISEDEITGLKDEVAIITGAASGIGLATAELFLSKGAHVVAVDMQESKKELPGTFFIKTDVTSWKDLVAVFKKTIEKYGKIDFVFANAGIGPRANYLSDEVDGNGDPVEPIQTTMNVNLRACMNTVTLGIFYMKKQESGGSIVMTASGSSYGRFPPADYTTSKHGVLGFLRSMSTQLHPKLPIRLNGISPSWTDTSVINMPADAFAKVNVPLQPPSAVAKSVALLATDANRHGEMIYSVDGNFKEIDGELLMANAMAMGYKKGDGDVYPELVKAAREAGTMATERGSGGLE